VERKNLTYLRSSFFTEDGQALLPAHTPQTILHNGERLQHFWIGNAHIIAPPRDVERGIEMAENPLRRVAETKAGKGRQRIPTMRGV